MELKIGDKTFKGYASLAPMAGVADRAMRELCISFGAAYTVGELTSAKGTVLGDHKSSDLLRCFERERPFANQLFGAEPEIMAKAAKIAESFNPDFLDINMGCPAPKVAVSSGGGSALLRDEKKAGEVIRTVVDAVKIPVTVKIRTGWDKNSVNAVRIAKIAEENGAAAITVHGRTREQRYQSPIDIDSIRDVKKAVKVPVIGNGDIIDARSAEYMYSYTGCDFIMVGRGSMGNPFIFDEINAHFENRAYTPPTIAEKIDVMRKQIELMKTYKGEHIGFLEARKHVAWYLKGFRGASELRRLCGNISSMADIDAICQKALELNCEL